VRDRSHANPRIVYSRRHHWLALCSNDEGYSNATRKKHVPPVPRAVDARRPPAQASFPTCTELYYLACFATRQFEVCLHVCRSSCRYELRTGQGTRAPTSVVFRVSPLRCAPRPSHSHAEFLDGLGSLLYVYLPCNLR
jgi:hypothetical protein